MSDPNNITRDSDQGKAETARDRRLYASRGQLNDVDRTMVDDWHDGTIDTSQTQAINQHLTNVDETLRSQN